MDESSDEGPSDLPGIGGQLVETIVRTLFGSPAWKDTALKLEAKVSRYEALLNVQVDPDINYVSGRVVSDNGGPFVDAVIANVGREQGAKSGDAVIDTDGMIGRIVATGAKASRVLLLTDLNSRLPVVIEPGHYKAVLSGDNTDWPKLEYLMATSSVSPGDRVVTSGDGGLIPPGLPVGLVIQTSDGNLRVQSFANHERLDYVRVLKYEFPTDVARQDPPALLTGPPVKAAPAPAVVEPAAPVPGARAPATPPASSIKPKPAVTKPAMAKPGTAAKPETTAKPAAPAPATVGTTTMSPVPDEPAPDEEEAPQPPTEVGPDGAPAPNTSGQDAPAPAGQE